MPVPEMPSQDIVSIVEQTVGEPTSGVTVGVMQNIGKIIRSVEANSASDAPMTKRQRVKYLHKCAVDLEKFIEENRENA